MKHSSNLSRSLCSAGLLSFTVLAVAVGYQKPHSAAAVRAPASVQQTMDLLIDPASDALWASVGTEQTGKGTKEHAPRTAADWEKVAGYAQSIAAGAKRLQTPGLAVGANAHSRLADADTPGTRTAIQIRADIDADPARFRAASIRLEEAANHALISARTHDAAGVLAAGAELDAACEACHAAYWYPRIPAQRLPSPAEFANRTNRF